MVRQPETRYAEGPEGKFWSGPHLIFHAAHQHADSALSVAYGSGAGAVDLRPESGGDDVRTVTVEL